MKIVIKNLLAVLVLRLAIGIAVFALKIVCWAFDIMTKDVQNVFVVDVDGFLAKYASVTSAKTVSDKEAL